MNGSANLVPQTKADDERNREAACCGSPRSRCCRRAVFAASTYRIPSYLSLLDARRRMYSARQLEGLRVVSSSSQNVRYQFGLLRKRAIGASQAF